MMSLRIYASMGLGLRISNYEATMVRYQYFLMQKLKSLTSNLPDQHMELVCMFTCKAMQLSIQQLNMARHHVDCDSRALVGAIALCHHAWLQLGSLPEETKRRVENMPFNGSGLFHAKTDDKLKNIHKVRLMARHTETPSQHQQEIKKRWQDYTEELYKKELNIPDNHNGVITDLKPDILECEVKWALGSLSNNKASGGDSIPAELFKILKDDAIKVPHSICQQIWKTQQWPQDWKRSVYILIPKKGNAKECSNYCIIVLISHASKVMLKILQVRLQQYVDRKLPEVQAGFRRGKGTRDQIANIRWIMEKAREFQKNIYFCFSDYAKAFDCVEHNKLWQVLKEMGVPDHLICLLRILYAGQEATHIMRKAGLDESPVGIKIAGRNINYLRYADDTTLMAESEEELKSLLMRVKEESAKVGLKLNIKKTKIMASDPLTSWQIDGEEMEVVTDFIFLGSKIAADGDCSQEFKRRLLLGRKAMANLDSILKSRDITLPTKVRIVKAMVFPVAMYGCESWIIRKAERQRIEAFELWCWRRLLRVSWTTRRSNRSVLEEISPDCSVEGQILKMKLKYFGHLMRRKESLEKSLMLGTIDGKRRRGWQRMRNGVPAFQQVLERLESDPVCQRLSLKSFLILPFQRITRLKLLLQNILKKTQPGTDEEVQATQAYDALEKSVQTLLDLKYLLLSCGRCSSFSIICKFDQQTVHPFFHVIYEKIKQDRPQDRPQGDPACHWPPSRRFPTNGYPLLSVSQPCPNPLDSALVYPKTPQFLNQDIVGHFVKGLAEIQFPDLKAKDGVITRIQSSPNLYFIYQLLSIGQDQVKDVSPSRHLLDPLCEKPSLYSL
ncbi:Rho guanine nucleotide exchange factor 5 [Varanus komodoensis]|nr:Rho guanine nucleotide exchange factor 5 [Varanus komodoensis]